MRIHQFMELIHGESDHSNKYMLRNSFIMTSTKLLKITRLTIGGLCGKHDPLSTPASTIILYIVLHMIVKRNTCHYGFTT